MDTQAAAPDAVALGIIEGLRWRVMRPEYPDERKVHEEIAQLRGVQDVCVVKDDE
jgi:hypothetical protein